MRGTKHSIGTKALSAGAAVLLAATGWATLASAQPAGQNAQLPKSWSYELRDGKRVPRGNRVTNPDGSWREQLRQGNCVTIKERSASGEYKETRECDPGTPR